MEADSMENTHNSNKCALLNIGSTKRDERRGHEKTCDKEDKCKEHKDKKCKDECNGPEEKRCKDKCEKKEKECKDECKGPEEKKCKDKCKVHTKNNNYTIMARRCSAEVPIACVAFDIPNC